MWSQGGRPPIHNLMLFEEANIRRRLGGIVSQLAPKTLREDLMQEAMVHLWRSEGRHPGRKEAWHLQGCRLHLQNLLRRGRSVDSYKRMRAHNLNGDAVSDGAEAFEGVDLTVSCRDEVSASDFLSRLTQRLLPQERATLGCLMDGLSARETANVLALSHTMINRHRSRIASLATKLGLASPTRQPNESSG